MKRLLLVAIMSILVISCKHYGVTYGEGDLSVFNFINDTVYDCTIEWRQSDAKTFDSVNISSSSQFVQELTGEPHIGDDLFQGRTHLTGASEAFYVFYNEAERFRYHFIYDATLYPIKSGGFWGQLPHSAVEHDNYRVICNYYLSDILAMANPE